MILIANKEKAQHELSALKAQINPHFLFNNLNTIYSLASKNDTHTKDIILKLSDFLRFVLYDTSSETILLEKEVEMIKTYIDLQKERIDPVITPVTFLTEGDFGTIRIAPFLMLPFVENCFKHGIGKTPGNIQIDLRLDGKHLLFKTENRIFLREKTGNGENGGIGINNVEKRLNLLYPGRHSLYLEEKEGMFRVTLSVELK
jgi:LytS/YehU family sensor histidine kinase